MPTIADDPVLKIFILRTSQRLVQRPARRRGAHDVVPALHDDDGKVRDAVRVREELAIRHEAAVDEVVAFNAGECESPVGRVGGLAAGCKEEAGEREWYHLGSSAFLMYSGSTISLDVAVSHRLHALALDIELADERESYGRGTWWAEV